MHCFGRDYSSPRIQPVAARDQHLASHAEFRIDDFVWIILALLVVHVRSAHLPVAPTRLLLGKIATCQPIPTLRIRLFVLIERRPCVFAGDGDLLCYPLAYGKGVARGKPIRSNTHEPAKQREQNSRLCADLHLQLHRLSCWSSWWQPRCARPTFWARAGCSRRRCRMGRALGL